MAETEKTDMADDAVAVCEKTKALNGHSEEESVITKSKSIDIKNGEVSDSDPQVNGELEDKSSGQSPETKRLTKDSEVSDNEQVSNGDSKDGLYTSEKGDKTTCDRTEAAEDEPMEVDENGSDSEVNTNVKGDNSEASENGDSSKKIDKKEEIDISKESSNQTSESKKSTSVSNVAGEKDTSATNESDEQFTSVSEMCGEKDTSVSKKSGEKAASISNESGDVKKEKAVDDVAIVHDDESDIEMIEESDPLAFSDAEFKLANKAKQSTKKDTNVIVIDTNTLLKNQGNLAAAAVSSAKSGSPTVTPIVATRSRTAPPASPSISSSAQTTASGNANIAVAATIQSALKAIASGNPGMQGLQNAYLNAIQSVLLAQSSGQVTNQQYLNQLQHYYNTLGVLQDEAYVIEAPSFIVPYVMEGKPLESIKDYLKRLDKEAIEAKSKEREAKAKEKKDKEEEDAQVKTTASSKPKDKDESKDTEIEVSEDGEVDGKGKKGEIKSKTESEENAEDKSKAEEEVKVDEAKDKSKSEEVKVDEAKDKSKSEEKVKVDETKEKSKSEEKDKSENDEKSISEVSTEEQDKKTLEDKKNKDIKDTDEEKSSTTIEQDDNADTKSKSDESYNEDDDKENDNSSSGDDDTIDLDKEDETIKEDLRHLGRWETYYRSALGKFFLDVGLSQVQEFIQQDLLKMQKRKVDKMKTNPSRMDIAAVKSLEYQLARTRKKNSHLSVDLKTCKFCTYKTESETVMNRHLESPHMVNYTYKCNFCEFETRGPQVILFHMEAEHNVRGRLERAPAFFQCPLCPYEDNNKSKMTRHSFSCVKKYKPEKNCDLNDWEPPAKIPKLQRGRPNLLNKTLEPMKMQNILAKSFGGFLPASLCGSLANNAASMNSNLSGRGRGRPVGSYKNISPALSSRAAAASLMYQSRGAAANLLQQLPGVTTAQQLSIANQVLQSVTQGGSNRVPRILPASANAIPGFGASSSITIQSVHNKSGSTKSPQQPSISITPLPRGGQSGSKSISTKDGNGSRPSFVICEICDGYIKDLEQLRNHMNLIHKVKIHPKMIYNRPPLNCQKCQHRFFTDQGLERHLLGTHGLVTSSMQEAANKGKDSGRCPICGKVFQWKLLNHVSRDHKMTLKPAHLSYKCTVCTATFNMYRLFENHVYSAHSVVNKNKNSSGESSSIAATAKKLSVADGPLKINDEITIIPQPAPKSKTESSSKPASKKTETLTVSKEITITKVGSRSSKRTAPAPGGNGVEIISLDDSPQKRQDSETRKRTSKRARTSL